MLFMCVCAPGDDSNSITLVFIFKNTDAVYQQKMWSIESDN